MYQKLILMGNLGRDVEVKTFDNGGKVATTSIATSAKYKNKAGELVEKTEWFNLKFSGRSVEIAEKYLKKGSKLLLEGRIETREYEKDAQKRIFTEVVVEQFRMISGGENAPTSVSGATSTAVDDIPPIDSVAENDLPF